MKMEKETINFEDFYHYDPSEEEIFEFYQKNRAAIELHWQTRLAETYEKLKLSKEWDNLILDRVKQYLKERVESIEQGADPWMTEQALSFLLYPVPLAGNTINGEK
jgi:hypothetical protein